MKTWLLNNCNNLDHVKLYKRPAAFFDLWTKDTEDRKAREVAEGDRCFVLSQDSARRILVSEFRFAYKVMATDSERPENTWVLCGTFVGGQLMTREQAHDHEVFRYFFNNAGHLCQWSINRYLTNAEATA